MKNYDFFTWNMEIMTILSFSVIYKHTIRSRANELPCDNRCTMYPYTGPWFTVLYQEESGSETNRKVWEISSLVFKSKSR